ncbi:MAG: hypothetical protein FJ096_00780 [Deltaproteobacteria bacterium]|nr:hypothetical protein [Deltaproteobacteria bacterium]
MSAPKSLGSGLRLAALLCLSLQVGCKKGEAPDASGSASASGAASESAPATSSSAGVSLEALGRANLTLADFKPGPPPTIQPSPPPEKKAAGPEGWSEVFMEVISAAPRRPLPRRQVVPKPWPECATSLAQKESAKKHEATWKDLNKAADERYGRADALAQAVWGPVQRTFLQTRRRLLDATAEGCTAETPSAECAPFIDRLRASEALGSFECRGHYVLRALDAPARDLLLCEADSRWTLIEIPDTARSAILGGELGAAAERDGLAAVAGIRVLRPTTDALSRKPMVPAKLRITGVAKLARFAQHSGDAASVLGKLAAAGMEPALAASLLTLGHVHLVVPRTDGGPSVVIEQRGQELPWPKRTFEPREVTPEVAEPCDGTARWEAAACATRGQIGRLDGWFSVAGRAGSQRIANYPPQPGPASGENYPPTLSARVLAFRQRVEGSGGFAPFSCELEDVTLATEDENVFYDRTRTLARRAGVAPGELFAWKLQCKTGEDASGGRVTVFVPSHDLWADAALGGGGFSVTGYHAVKAGHFTGDLRALAEAGLLEVPRGAKLTIGGYTSLRRVGRQEWHVGFDASCTDNGLSCAFRDGRGNPTITGAELTKCDIANFAYPPK